MKPAEPTPRERAAAANGDYQEWIEYEAEQNRDPREYMGGGDPDPKYDLAPLLKTSFRELAFIREMEVFFDDIETA